MRLKTAKRGRNAGGRFWSCVKFPKCRGARDFIIDRPGSAVQSTKHRDNSHTLNKVEPRQSFQDEGSEERPSSRPPNMTIPVDWIEGEPRTKFNYEYLSIGSIPGVLRESVGEIQTLKRLLSHTLLLWSNVRDVGEVTEHARLTSALLAKLLQRGHTPLSTFEIEHAALKRHNLIEKVVDLAKDKIEVGWQLKTGLKNTDFSSELEGEWITKERFTLADETSQSLLQSHEEVEFLTKWVPSNLGKTAGHWFLPQAPLDTLLESAMREAKGARRVDFLVCHPGGRPFVIEIDGPEHLSAQEIDYSRDSDLGDIGIDVVRVSNQEVRNGKGPQLDEIKSRFEKREKTFQPASSKGDFGRLAADCSIATKIQFVIARAISLGWLTGDEWEIDLSGVTSVGTAGVLDVLRLLSCFDALYGQRSVPKLCTVRVIGGSSITWKFVDGRWEEVHGKEAQGNRITIAVERKSSPFHTIDFDDTPDFIIRPAFLPVPLALEPLNDIPNRAISPASFQNVRPALREFLRQVFRKYSFWPRQDEAIFNTLCQKDSVVLLPTGAGKSIIYQLAGLLMPGITIVVDPIIALIEDQVEGLKKYGIDRVAGIVSSIDGRHDRDRLLRQIECGEYQFVLHSPERLQSPEFRGTLNAIRENSLVNLAVIDEAHCVSEWGHDFRPAYLNLGNILRELCKDSNEKAPPLLALTGTASRAVLKDVCTDLGIDKSNRKALIRPESFDRKELNFEIKRARTSEEAIARLRGSLYAMPGKFGMRRAQFFVPNKQNTASGIIFTRTVNSRYTGIIDTMEVVQSACKAQVTIYSGQPPKYFDGTNWDRKKRSYANAFKHNIIPVLVATKAFGMGIDKPNIRYIIHFGMPGSLESFYQEAGRAGRDRKRALCVTVFTEYDQKRSDGLIDPNIDLSELNQRFAEANRNRSIGDDVTSAIWFHLNTFKGSEREIEDIGEILNRINLESPDRREFTWMDDRDKRRKEHAIIRLLKLGVIQDYQIEFGSRKLIVDSEPFDFDRCRERLLDYIRAAQPARAKAFAEKLDGIPPGRPHENALNFARQLVKFTYDVIERSRRRMIQESVLLARSSNNDNEIRARLLDYLQEGLSSERINGLLEQQEVQIEEWFKLIEAIQTELDAGELRGLCARLLESSPDHPGLLLGRAIAETMCTDHNNSVSWQGISRAIAACAEYRVSKNDIQLIIRKSYDLTAARADELGIPLTMAILDIAAADSAFDYCAAIARRRATELKDQETIEIIFYVFELQKAVLDADVVTKLITERYSHPEIAQFL